MDFALWYTLLLMMLMSLALALELFQPAFVVFTTLIFLVLGNVISIDEAFIGFSNKGMLTVGILFIVSAALNGSGLFERTIHSILGHTKKRLWIKYLKLMFPVAAFSAFLNNTPIVASLIPIIKKWSQKNGLAPSKFLIPLSYASILGGVCTLIGTSTNLIVHGLLLQHGLNGFSFFEITKVGLPVAVLSILLLSIISRKFLPSNKDPIVELGEKTREFVVEMKVDPEYPMLEKTIEEANLRHLQGLFLFQISRDDEVITPVSPREKIFVNDRLFFTGLPETIFEIQKSPGLHIIKDSEYDLKNIDSDQSKTYEAVVSITSPLVGQTVRESNFRKQYNAVILAIHRSGSRINKKVGDIVLEPGDTLFILAKKGFDKKWYNSPDFSLVSASIDFYSKPQWKGNVAVLLILAMVVAAATEIVPMIIAAGCTAIVMILLKIISTLDAQRSVNWEVLFIIAASLGIGQALENSGLSTILANGIVHISGTFGIVGAITCLFVITSTYTFFITNNAVAAIMFPVALSTANFMNLPPTPFMVVLAVGASTCFASPIGYQTNLMVYSAGGYKYSDFFKIGLIINIFVGIFVTILTYYVYF